MTRKATTATPATTATRARNTTKIAATAAVVCALATALIGLAGPAAAQPGVAIPTHLDHHTWLDDNGGLGPKAHAEHADTSVRTGPSTVSICLSTTCMRH